MLLVLCSSSSDEESAQQAHIARGGCLRQHLALRRTFGGASRPAAMLVPPALPCFSGA